jgi:hypothetical protein
MSPAGRASRCSRHGPSLTAMCVAQDPIEPSRVCLSLPSVLRRYPLRAVAPRGDRGPPPPGSAGPRGTARGVGHGLGAGAADRVGGGGRAGGGGCSARSCREGAGELGYWLCMVTPRRMASLIRIPRLRGLSGGGSRIVRPPDQLAGMVPDGPQLAPYPGSLP